MTPEQLIVLAQEARARAFAPYSKFQVGAALLGESGRVYSGCNVEISSYGLTMCAERVAIFKAVSEGEQRFRSIAIVGPPDVAITPCGACRQVLWEFATELEVYTQEPSGAVVRQTIRELLPGAFGRDALKV